MGDSLQDQLRALGLARDEADRSKTERKKSRAGTHRAKRSGTRKESRGQDATEPSLARAWSLREREEQKQAEQARKRKQAEDRRRQEINRAIREIVTAHRQNVESAEVARNFLYKGRIRKLYVTPEQQRALSAGALGIVFLTGGYHLLAPQQIDAVRAISPEHVVDLGGEAEGDESGSPVPDDLVW
jgi:uncharacterized protein YaiL (DUF2058 family)